MGERTSELSGGTTEHKSSDEIRKEIRETQRNIGETVDSIHYRLSPSHMMDEAKDTLRDVPRRAGEGLMSRIKDNPIPAAIAGLGLWMLFRNDKSRDVEKTYNYDAYGAPRPGYYPPGRATYPYGGRTDFAGYGYDRAFDDGRGRMSHVADTVRDKAASVKDKASDLADNLGDKAHEMSDRAHELGDRAGEFADETLDRAEAYGRRMAWQARSSGQELWDTLENNPLILGAAGVIVGALVGASIPETDRENRLMGEASDSVKQTAISYAEEGMEKAKHVASAATDAATSVASREINKELDNVQQPAGRSTSASSTGGASLGKAGGSAGGGSSASRSAASGNATGTTGSGSGSSAPSTSGITPKTPRS
jgi:hypothetical protein